jgi:hypothetical protein
MFAFLSRNGGRISARALSIQHPSPGGNRGKDYESIANDGSGFAKIGEAAVQNI